MPMFVRLSVRDVAATAQWFADALGFRSVYSMPGTDGSQVMNHIRLGRYQDLMLVAQAQKRNAATTGDGVVLYFTTNAGVERLAQQARSAGTSVEGPTETPWNTREVTFTAPDGYVLTFSEVVEPNRSFDDVMSTKDSPESKGG